jgi:hypothetical protein
LGPQAPRTRSRMANPARTNNPFDLISILLFEKE